jgi:spermidine synthase
VALLGGAGTLVIELAAVRLLAPWFGTSVSVWTNVIAVVLGALALGYALGARWSSRARPDRALAWCTGAAGLLSAWLPALCGHVSGLFAPRGVSLEQAAALTEWGSLAAATCLFAPPAALLGCVAPLVTECLARVCRASAGRAGGWVLCASTLGSLAGAFATTHWMVPSLGLARTFLVAGALLFLACGIVVASIGIWRAPWIAGALALLAAAGVRWRPPPSAAPLRVLAERDSAYQFLRVVEDSSVTPAWRLLQVNEGLDSFQSVWSPKQGLLGQGFYYDYFALPAWLEGARGRWRVLVLGLGAGTAFRVLAGASPAEVELELWGVELDREAVELGREWFDLAANRRPGRVLAGFDARTALRILPSDFDQIVLDCYANQAEIPAHLFSREFLRELRGHLRPGGWFVANVGGFGPHDPVLEAAGQTTAEAFQRPCVALRVPRSRNWIVGARQQADWPAWRIGRSDIERALLEPLAGPLAMLAFAPGGGAVMSDDHSDLDRRQRRSLLLAARARR